MNVIYDKNEKLELNRMCSSLVISIFRASNFVEFMWPSFAMSQFFGLFPYKINCGVLSSSIPGYVYSSSILTLLTLILITIAYSINFTKELNYESLPALLQADCYILFGYLYFLSSFILSNKKLELFKKISEISHYVSKSKWNKSARFIHAKDILGLSFLIGQMPNTLGGKFLDVFFKVTCSYLTLVIYSMDNQYVNCVLATKISLNEVNNQLLLFEDRIQKVKEFYKQNATIAADESYSKKLLISKYLEEIKSVRIKYEDICQVVKIINDSFSIPIIISIGLTFVEVTFSLYFYFLKSIGAKEINLEKQIWYYYFITSATYYISKFLIAVWTCETTKNEAEKSKVIVHRILIRLYEKEIIQELQSFSLQMIQRNTSFSVHGIPLDGSIVSGIASGISTYLLILIQFLMAKNQCSEVIN